MTERFEESPLASNESFPMPEIDSSGVDRSKFADSLNSPRREVTTLETFSSIFSFAVEFENLQYRKILLRLMKRRS